MQRMDSLRTALADQGRLPPGEGLAQLVAYVALLVERPGPNLTAARGFDEAWSVLVEPSLGIVAAWDAERPPRCVVDLGSGNGFPGLAAAAWWPEARIVLVERRRAKAAAIGELLGRLGRTGIDVFSEDARDVPLGHPDLAGSADLVAVRAVATIALATKWAAPLLAPGGRVVHWKTAKTPAEERAEGLRVAQALGLRPLPDVPSAQGAASSRRLVLFERPPPKQARQPGGGT